MKRFVVVGLQGGLGNQLFQYASGYGIATKVGAELLFDATRLPAGEHWLPGLLGPHYRDASRVQLLRLGVLHGSDGVRDHLARSALSHAVDAARRIRGMTPRTMPQGQSVGGYDERLLSIDLPTQLLGWFQSDRYFSHVADDVVHRLRLPQNVLLRHPNAQPIVALSFRRGDYVRMGWQLPLSYYERALAVVMERVPDATFLVFGDDPEFVRFATEWVSRVAPTTNVYDFCDGVIDHLALASECDHAVIANSSYAWWGAWLGDRRAGDTPRLVIAPEDYRQRFGPDILPSNWLALPSG